jgi:hypothetical protein
MLTRATFDLFFRFTMQITTLYDGKVDISIAMDLSALLRLQAPWGLEFAEEN